MAQSLWAALLLPRLISLLLPGFYTWISLSQSLLPGTQCEMASILETVLSEWRRPLYTPTALGFSPKPPVCTSNPQTDQVVLLFLYAEKICRHTGALRSESLLESHPC